MKLSSKKLHTGLKRRLLIFVGICCTALIAFLYTTEIISLVFTSLLFILGSLSLYFKKISGDLDIGISFIPFSTILFLYVHGIAFALVACFAMLLISSLLMGQLKPYILVSIILFSLVALIGLFLPFDIIVYGIILVCIYTILFFIASLFLGYNIVSTTIYSAGSIIFNYILFSYFAPIIILVL